MISVEMIQERLQKLKEVLKDARRLIVLTHDNPDPDSISCAITLSSLVNQVFGMPTLVRYSGIVGRAENREMIRSLNLKIKILSKNELKSGDPVALVDCQPHTGNVSLPKKANPLIVIDHHSLRKTTKAPFVDVREGYGATATILGEYLLVSGLGITSQLATALCYGISSETQRLGREATQNDMAIYLALFADASKKMLSRIENPKLPRHYFLTLNRALHQSYVYKNAVVSYLGDIVEPDFVPIVADMLLRCERISWSLCMGKYKAKILISIRTTRRKSDAGNFLRKLIGKKGTAGGHDMIAGGQIPCSDKTDSNCDEMQKEIAVAFLKKLGHKDVNEMTPLLIQEGVLV